MLTQQFLRYKGSQEGLVHILVTCNLTLTLNLNLWTPLFYRKYQNLMPDSLQMPAATDLTLNICYTIIFKIKICLVKLTG